MASLTKEAAVATGGWCGSGRRGRSRSCLGAMIAIALLLSQPQIQIAVLLTWLNVRAFEEFVEAGQDHAGSIVIDHRLPGAAVVVAIGAITLVAAAHLDIIIARHDRADERLIRAGMTLVVAVEPASVRGHRRAGLAFPGNIEVVQRIVDIQIAEGIGAAKPVLIVVWVGLIAQLPPGIHTTQRGWVEEIQRRLALKAKVGRAAHKIAPQHIDRAG